MVFALNFCLVFLARDRCSSKAIPEIILDFFFFFWDWLGWEIKWWFQAKRKWITDVCKITLSVAGSWCLALPCSSEITCGLLGKLFLLLKLYIVLFSMHLLCLKALCTCLGNDWQKLKWMAAWAGLDPQTRSALDLELPFCNFKASSHSKLGDQLAFTVNTGSMKLEYTGKLQRVSFFI